jgi:hypothetical protein
LVVFTCQWGDHHHQETILIQEKKVWFVVDDASHMIEDHYFCEYHSEERGGPHHRPWQTANDLNSSNPSRPAGNVARVSRFAIIKFFMQNLKTIGTTGVFRLTQL